MFLREVLKHGNINGCTSEFLAGLFSRCILRPQITLKNRELNSFFEKNKYLWRRKNRSWKKKKRPVCETISEWGRVKPDLELSSSSFQFRRIIWYYLIVQYFLLIIQLFFIIFCSMRLRRPNKYFNWTKTKCEKYK